MSHWYEETPEGVAARHFVEMATRPGELRPTRVTDVRKWWKQGRVVVPSVTTVLNTLDKAALLNWKVDQHLYVAHDLACSMANAAAMHDEVGPNLEQFVSECKRRTEIELSKAPDAGTDIHRILEDFMNGKPVADVHAPMCQEVWANVFNKTGIPKTRWDVEKRFTDSRGFGGCADLVDICSLERVYDDSGWVIDYKTKQTADKFKPGRMAYPDHSRQLAAYREGLGIPNARAANVFICIETGEVDFHEHTEEQLRNGWEVFQHALAIWQLTNDYPMTQERAA